MSTMESVRVRYGSTQADLQRYFDDTVRHLLQMKHRAINDSGQCEYLTPMGERCAVGVHIPPWTFCNAQGVYAEHYVGSVMSMVEEYPDLAGVAWPACEDGLNLAYELQQVHDNSENWGLGGIQRHALRVVAENTGLMFNLVT